MCFNEIFSGAICYFEIVFMATDQDSLELSYMAVAMVTMSLWYSKLAEKCLI